MNKKNIFKILILFFICSCGYQPLYTNKNDTNIKIKELILIGNAEINKKILFFINVEENTKDDDGFSFILTTQHNDNITSKDNSGNPLTFQKNISTNLLLKNNSKTIRKKFSSSFTYSNKENKFDLNEYQNNVKENLIKEISEKMIIFFSLQNDF